MQKTKKYGLDHIEPVENELNPTILERITTSPLPESETKFMTAVEIDYKNVGLIKKGSVFLCDSPGFDDTNGPEVDIANGHGIARVIKNCKSVRPIILISAEDYAASRMKGLKSLTQIIIGMLNNPKEYVSSFSYLFTKFHGEDKNNAQVKIKALVDSIIEDPNQNNDESFSLFLQELCDKMDGNAVQFLDVVSENSQKDRKNLFKFFDGINHISRPDEAFKFSISESSSAVIKEQLLKHELVISSSIKEKDYDLVGFKLREIKNLKELLEESSISQIYDQCLKKIMKAVNDQYSDIKSKFNTQCKIENTLDERDIEDYKGYIEYAKKVDVLKNEFHLEEIPFSETLKQHIESECKNFKNYLENCDLDDIFLKNVLDKLNLFE